MQAYPSRVILIAPNIGEQMGGEAIKALQIYQAVKKAEPNAIQITHSRCEAEVRRLGLPDVHFVRDTFFSILLWKSVVFRGFLDYWFSIKAVKIAEFLAGTDHVVIHQTEPNSPVSPRSFSAKHVNVLGPINGNIYYPAAFRAYESTSARLRRVFHMPLQIANRIFFSGIRDVEIIFAAGGARTEASLYKRGCKPEQIVKTLDCGIKAELIDRPRICHRGTNLRFVHFGRLVFHKGTRLIIKSLAKTTQDISLDVVGRGPELEECRRLCVELGLTARINFLDWYESHADLLKSLYQYRGLVLPSIEDANGIVVQEAMALGLPPICLNWGGPQLLIDHGKTGYLVEPTNEDAITTSIASYMDLLATDGKLAEDMSVSARTVASQWVWEEVIAEWIGAYPRYRSSPATARLRPRSPGSTSGD